MRFIFDSPSAGGTLLPAYVLGNHTGLITRADALEHTAPYSRSPCAAHVVESSGRDSAEQCSAQADAPPTIRADTEPLDQSAEDTDKRGRK
jgi:hypothetical protein